MDTKIQSDIKVKHPVMDLYGQPTVNNIDSRSKMREFRHPKEGRYNSHRVYHPLSAQRTNPTLQESGPHSNMLLGSQDEGE